LRLRDGFALRRIELDAADRHHERPPDRRHERHAVGLEPPLGIDLVLEQLRGIARRLHGIEQALRIDALGAFVDLRFLEVRGALEMVREQ